MVARKEAADILRELRVKQFRWANEYGLEYSARVLRALEMGADALEAQQEDGNDKSTG